MIRIVTRLGAIAVQHTVLSAALGSATVASLPFKRPGDGSHMWRCAACSRCREGVPSHP